MTASRARADAQSFTARKISCELVRMHVERGLDQLGHGMCWHVYPAGVVLESLSAGAPFLSARSVGARPFAPHSTRAQSNPQKATGGPVPSTTPRSSAITRP